MIFYNLKHIWCYIFHLDWWRRASELDGFGVANRGNQEYYGFRCDKCDCIHLIPT